MAVLSESIPRILSKTRATRFDPNNTKCSELRGVHASIKMSRLDQITPAPAMFTSNFTTPAGKSAKYASPMVDAPMSSVLKSKSGNAIAHERSGNLSPAAGRQARQLLSSASLKRLLKSRCTKMCQRSSKKLLRRLSRRKSQPVLLNPI